MGEYHDTGNEAIECLQFSPNGSMLVVGNRAGILHLYQVSNGGKFNRIGRCIVSTIEKKMFRGKIRIFFI